MAEPFIKGGASSSSSTFEATATNRPKRLRDEKVPDTPDDVSQIKRAKEREVEGADEMHKIKLPEEDDSAAEKSSEDKPKAISPFN